MNSDKQIDPVVVLSAVDPRLHESLVAWIKFGTVFIVYRIGSYLLFDAGRTDKPLFDMEMIRLVVFVLIGFTLYYLLVKPYVPFPEHDLILRNTINDTLMFSTVLIVTQFLESYMNNTPFLTEQWVKNSSLILLSFIIYNVFVSPFIPRKNIPLKDLPMVNNLAKYGFFMIILRILEGKSLLDVKWIASVVLVLIGFLAYFYGTQKIVRISY